MLRLGQSAKLPDDEETPEVPSVASDNSDDPDSAEPAKQEIIERLQPYVHPELVNQAASAVEAMLVHERHSGPLPSAKEFRSYDLTVPGAAGRILEMAERNQSHRQSLETQVVKSDLDFKNRGQALAFVSLVLMLGVVLALAYLGHANEGAWLGAAIIGGVIAIFHGQKWFQSGRSSEDEDNQ